jgi:hypothetical protein
MASDIAYPALTVTRKTGEELVGDTRRSLGEFWRWAHSDLNSNAERGKFAEYLVSLAMGCADGTSREWAAFDVESPEGIKIEVKTSAYLQTWGHKTLSRLSFGIKPTRAWDHETNELAPESERRRQGDVYVFCVENCQEQDQLNPLDLDQWDFYPLATKTLDERVGDQGSIGLTSLVNLGAVKASFAGLRDAVIRQYQTA